MDTLKLEKHRYGVLKYDSISIIGVCLYFAYGLSRTIYTQLGIGSNLIGYFILASCYTMLILCFLLQRTKPMMISLALLTVVFITLVFSFWLHPENGEVISQGFAFQYGVTIVPFVCALNNKTALKRVIIIYALISYISSFVILIPFLRNGGYWIANYGNSVHHLEYNMSLGYQALISGLLLYWYYRQERKAFFLALSVIGILISIVWGSRGCLLCYALYLLIFLLSQNTSKKTSRIIVLIIASLIVFYLIGINNILNLVSNTLSFFGISSRTLKSINSFSDVFLNDSGRKDIWNILLEKMWDKPIFGYGAFGDRQILRTFYSQSVTLYSHNIFLEVLISFGVPIGICIIITLLSNVIKATKKCRNSEIFGYYICFLSYIFGNLMVSNSFWNSTVFWFFVGMMILINQTDICSQ